MKKKKFKGGGGGREKKVIVREQILSFFVGEIKEIKKSRIDKRKSYYLFDRQWSQKTIKHADRY